MGLRTQLRHLSLAWTRRWHSSAKPRPLTSPESIAPAVVDWLEQGIDLKVILEVLNTANAYTKKALEYRMGQALGYSRPDLPQWVPEQWTEPTEYGRAKLSEMREVLRQPGLAAHGSDGTGPVGSQAPTIGSLRARQGSDGLAHDQGAGHQNGQGHPPLDGAVVGSEVELQRDPHGHEHGQPDQVEDLPGKGDGGELGQGHLL